MKRFIASVVVLGMGLALVLTTTNEAAAKSGPNPGGQYSAFHGQYHSHQPGYFALNHGFHNWSSWRWNSRFHCYYYWYPSGRCYYYWYAPARCYYPISYIDTYPPPAVQYQTPSPGAAPLPVQIQVTSINQNGQNGLPPLPGPPSGPGPGK